MSRPRDVGEVKNPILLDGCFVAFFEKPFSCSSETSIVYNIDGDMKCVWQRCLSLSVLRVQGMVEGGDPY